MLKGRSDRWTIVAAGLAGCVVALSTWRLFYGVDFTDEAYYVAVPFRFVLGARPYVDETAPPQQTTALLLYPFVAGYRAMFGMGGIILAARAFHLVFACLVAACTFIGLRPFVRRPAEALVAALVSVAFVPFNLPAPSYNNIGSGLVTAGSFLGVGFLATRRVRLLAGAGLANGLGAFAYPPLILPAIAFTIPILAFTSRPRGRLLSAYVLLAVAFPAAAFGVVVVWGGVTEAWTAFVHAREFASQGGGLSKLVSIARDTVAALLEVPFGAIAIIALVTVRTHRALLVRWLGPTLPLLLCPVHELRETSGSLDYMTIYGMAALPLYALTRDDRRAKTLFLAIWPVALLGGTATSWSSANGATNFALGFVSASVLTTVLLGLSLPAREAVLGPPDRHTRAIPFVASGILLGLLVAFQFLSIYRDSHFTHLDSRVRMGPYAGIYTTPMRRRFIERLTTDLHLVSRPYCRVLFFDGFPAGYLMSVSRPDTNAVFTLRVPTLVRLGDHKLATYRQLLLDYYRSNRHPPDVVVRMTKVPGDPVNRTIRPGFDPLDHFVIASGDYAIARRRPSYAIYVRRGASCRQANVPRSALHRAFGSP